MGYSLCFVHSSIWASTWLVKELLITKLGWPMAQPRFTRRPSANRITWRPLGSSKRSTYNYMFDNLWLSVRLIWSEEAGIEQEGDEELTWGLIVSFLHLDSSHAQSTSQSKWPMLQQMALSFIAIKCSGRIISQQPVAVTKMLVRATASSKVVTS